MKLREKMQQRREKREKSSKDVITQFDVLKSWSKLFFFCTCSLSMTPVSETSPSDRWGWGWGRWRTRRTMLPCRYAPPPLAILGYHFFFSAAPLNVVPSAAKIFNTIRRHNEQQSHHYSLFLHKPPVTNNHWSPQIVKAPADRNCPQTVAW